MVPPACSPDTKPPSFALTLGSQPSRVLSNVGLSWVTCLRSWNRERTPACSEAVTLRLSLPVMASPSFTTMSRLSREIISNILLCHLVGMMPTMSCCSLAMSLCRQERVVRKSSTSVSATTPCSQASSMPGSRVLVLTGRATPVAASSLLLIEAILLLTFSCILRTWWLVFLLVGVLLGSTWLLWTPETAAGLTNLCSLCPGPSPLPPRPVLLLCSLTPSRLRFIMCDLMLAYTFIYSSLSLLPNHSAMDTMLPSTSSGKWSMLEKSSLEAWLTSSPETEWLGNNDKDEYMNVYANI